MIEMLQQPKLQAGNTQKTTPRADPVNNNTPPSARDEASFEQHLDQQTRRATAARQEPASGQKTEENTLVNEAEADMAETDGIVEEVASDQVMPSDEVSEFELADVSDAVALLGNAPEITEINPSESLAENEPGRVLTEQMLPPDGKDLPPELLAATPVMPTPMPEQAVEVVENNVIARTAKPLADMPLPQAQLAAARQAASVSPQQAMESSLVADNAIEFKLPEMNLATGQPKAAGSGVEAVGKLNTLFTTVAAAASLNQQVPVTTGLASLHTQAAPLTATDSGLFSLPSLSASIAAPVHQQGAWTQGLTEQMSFMLQGKFQSAEMKLNPAHLGPMEIKLSMQDDQASITFVTQHAAVRDALDAAMPRLREMFESQGLNLANVDVSQHSGQQGSASDQLADSKANHPAGQQATEVAPETGVPDTVMHISGRPGLSLYV